MEQEVKEVVYIAVAAIILAIVLGMISIVMMISRDIADVRNAEVVGNKQVKEYRIFNKYDKHKLTGDEVVECITQFYGDNVEILVYTSKYDRLNSNQYIDNNNEEYNTDSNASLTDFLRYRQKDLIDGNTDKYETDTLVENYKTKEIYRAYLIFDGVKPGDVFNTMNNIVLLTGDTIEELDKAYDSSTGTSLAYSAATGILIVRVD